MDTKTETISAVQHQAIWTSMLRQFARESSEALRIRGISPMQYQALLEIRLSTSGDGEGLSMGGLADKLSVRHNSAVGLVNRLESNGLVERARSLADRRVSKLSLTPEGLKTLEALANAHSQGLKRIAPEVHGVITQSH